MEDGWRALEGQPRASPGMYNPWGGTAPSCCSWMTDSPMVRGGGWRGWPLPGARWGWNRELAGRGAGRATAGEKRSEEANGQEAACANGEVEEERSRKRGRGREVEEERK